MCRYKINYLLLRNDMSTAFLQQILSGKLLLIIIVETKSNLSVKFKFEPITTNHLYIICCKNVVNVATLFIILSINLSFVHNF